MSNVFLFSLFAPVSQTGKKQARYSIFLIIKNFQRPPTLSGDSYFSVPIRMFRHSRFVIKPSGIVLMSVTSYRTISVEENQKKNTTLEKRLRFFRETIPRPDCYRTLPRPTSISHFGQLDGGTLTRTQQPKRRKHPKKKTQEATWAVTTTRNESGPRLNPTPSPLPANRFPAKLHQLSRKLHAENPNFPHPKFTKCGSNVGNPRKGDKRRREWRKRRHASVWSGALVWVWWHSFVVVVLGKNRFNNGQKGMTRAKRNVKIRFGSRNEGLVLREWKM